MKKIGAFALGLTMALTAGAFVGCNQPDKKLTLIDCVSNASNAAYAVQQTVQNDFKEAAEAEMRIAAVTDSLNESALGEFQLHSVGIYAYEYIVKALENGDIDYSNDVVYYKDNVSVKSNFKNNNCNLVINGLYFYNDYNMEVDIKCDSDGNPLELVSKMVKPLNESVWSVDIILGNYNFKTDTLLTNRVYSAMTNFSEVTSFYENFSEGLSFDEVKAIVGEEQAYSIESSKFVMSGEVSSEQYHCSNVVSPAADNKTLFDANMQKMDSDLSTTTIERGEDDVQIDFASDIATYAVRRSEFVSNYEEDGDFVPVYTYLTKSEMLNEITAVDELVENDVVDELLASATSYLNTAKTYNGQAGELIYSVQYLLVNNPEETVHNTYYTLSKKIDVETYVGVIYTKDNEGAITIVSAGDISAEIVKK
ncbi:MAG: hypothetical protein E7359_03090 [Clostridiales bacterium]|nr:hypothetical protein [Clostridiales bacterium]